MFHEVNNGGEETKISSLKGTGSRDGIKIFWQNWIFVGLNMSNYWFWNLERWASDELLSLSFYTRRYCKMKTYWRNGSYLSVLPKYWATLLVSYWFIRWTLDFYWSIVQVQFHFLAYSSKSLLEGCREMKKFLRRAWICFACS